MGVWWSGEDTSILGHNLCVSLLCKITSHLGGLPGSCTSPLWIAASETTLHMCLFGMGRDDLVSAGSPGGQHTNIPSPVVGCSHDKIVLGEVQ